MMASKRQATLDLFTVFSEGTDGTEKNVSNGESFVTSESIEETVSNLSGPDHGDEEEARVDSFKFMLSPVLY